MPTLPLTHIQYTQLDPMTWCATAQVSEPLYVDTKAIWGKSARLSVSHISDTDFHKIPRINWYYHPLQSQLSVKEVAHNQRQRQRKGVRLLLKTLLNKLKITDTLDESSFPYRLIESQHYVCFSHTDLCHRSDSGKDSEHNNSRTLSNHIAVAISRRHTVGIDIETNEVAWHVAQRFYHPHETAALQALPTSERSAITKLLWQIKESFIKVYQYKLAQGLGVDYSYLMPNLINIVNENAALSVISDNKTSYRIVVLPSQQTVIVF
ncbi:4'-phosphopantetheinyl transferase superfamily protein [Psychrobacter sp. W2-37-MNA-CIBAN-0211]|uniref:4'-phosphopantetheinyl transferase family protein n=1 Tax=Psychrobacter sp. W2-37-MNA-CIBAN-0211 TaxID=3140443 RepID=UPI003331F4CB